MSDRYKELRKRGKRDGFSITASRKGYRVKRTAWPASSYPAQHCKDLDEVQAVLDNYRADWPDGFARDRGVLGSYSLAEQAEIIAAREADKPVK